MENLRNYSKDIQKDNLEQQKVVDAGEQRKEYPPFAGGKTRTEAVPTEQVDSLGGETGAEQSVAEESKDGAEVVKDSPNAVRERMDFTKENIDTNRKRQAIIEYLNGETEAKFARLVGMGKMSEAEAKKAIFDTKSKLNDLRKNYAVDHNDEAFLNVTNAILEQNINQASTIINTDESLVKKLGVAKKLHESIVDKNKNGEINNSVMKAKLRSLEKAVNKIYDETGYDLYAEERVAKENKAFAEAFEKTNKAQTEYAQKCKEYEAKNGGILTAEQQEELENLRKKVDELWRKRSELNLVVSESEDARKKRALEEISQEEKAKAEARKQKLEGVLGAQGEQDEAETQSGEAKEDTDIVSNMNAAKLAKFFRTGVVGSANRNREKSSRITAEEYEEKRRLEMQEFFGAMRPKTWGEEQAFDTGMMLFEGLVKSDDKNVKKQSLEEVAMAEAELTAADDAQRKTEGYRAQRAIMLAIDQIFKRAKLDQFDEMKDKFGEDAAYTYAYGGLLNAKNYLLGLYNPQAAGQVLSRATGRPYDADKYSRMKPQIPEEAYRTAQMTVATLEKKIMKEWMERKGLKNIAEGKASFNETKNSNEYKALVADQKEKASQEEKAEAEAKVAAEAKAAAEAEAVAAEKAKSASEKAGNAVVEAKQKDIFRFIRERSRLAGDYVKGFFLQDAENRVKNYTEGNNPYNPENQEQEAYPGALEAEKENREKTVRLLSELNLDSLFRGSAREMEGKDHDFEASYIYSELDRKANELRSEIESRSTPAEEKNRLKEQFTMVHAMMENFADYYSDKFGVDRNNVRMDLLKIQKTTLNRARTLFRNIIRKRS